MSEAFFVILHNMKIHWFIIPMFSVLVACNTAISPVLNQERLESQSFAINTEKDTTVTTEEGIQVIIPAGSIKAATVAVTLEIKEALSIYDMINGGLTTQAGKEILSSNGMFYINTKEPSTIIKPLEIKIPALYADTAMQLYKGKKEKDKINWESPASLAVKGNEVIDRGKVLFEQNCAMCHRTDNQLTGPSLAYVEERWASADLLYHFINNSAEVLAHGNEYANCLYCEYNKTSMPAYPNLTGKDIEEILAFVNRETVRLKIPRTPKKMDSILYYKERYKYLTNRRNSLINENGDKVTVDIKSDDITYNTPDTAGLPEKVAVVTGQAEYYQIKVDAYGWYNIDLLLKDRSDVAKSRLVVKITGDYNNEINTYLVIPQLKVFTEGGLLTNGIEYGFYKQDGTIYLPSGQDAFIMAIGEEKGALFFGKQSFVTSADQIIDLPVNKISKANLDSLLKQLKLNNVNFSVTNSVNADSIRAIDEEMEKIKKIMPVCNCMGSDTSLSYPVPGQKIN